MRSSLSLLPPTFCLCRGHLQNLQPQHAKAKHTLWLHACDFEAHSSHQGSSKDTLHFLSAVTMYQLPPAYSYNKAYDSKWLKATFLHTTDRELLQACITGKALQSNAYTALCVALASSVRLSEPQTKI